MWFECFDLYLACLIVFYMLKVGVFSIGGGIMIEFYNAENKLEIFHWEMGIL